MAFNSTEKPTTPQFPAMLSVFNILIYVVYHEFDKNCIKTLEIKKFQNFCHFGVIFLFNNRIYLFMEDQWTTNL